MAAPSYVGGHMSQAEFLGYMSSEAGWNFFVNSILPVAATGQFTVEGGTAGQNAAPAELIAAVRDAGSQLGGLDIPTATLEAARNPTKPAPVTNIPAAPPITDGLDALRRTMQAYGAGQDVVDTITRLNNQGLDVPAIIAQIQQGPWWQTRFAGVVARRKAGLDGSEADQVSYEQQIDSMMKQYGITGYTSDDAARWYGEDKSASEMSGRANIAAQWAYSEPQEARDAVQRLWGISAGDLTHFAFDENHALPEIQRKLDAAQIAGSASVTGVGQLSAYQALAIGQYANPGQATTQLAQIAKQNALYKALPGEGDNFNVDDLIRAYFGGDQGMLNRIRQRNAARDFGTAAGGVSQTAKGAVGAGVVQP